MNELSTRLGDVRNALAIGAMQLPQAQLGQRLQASTQMVHWPAYDGY